MTAEEIRKRLSGTMICVVPYCHADWAWTHTRRWHALRYVHGFERVLEIMRQDSSFRWYFDCAVTHLQPLLHMRPDLVPELRQRVSEGRIAICGGYANVRPNMVGEETFIRSLIHGRRLFSELFREASLSVHADIVDVALGHPQVPQLLKLGGYGYARFWRPQAGLSEAGVPYEFIWRGLDSSEVLCSRGCYGGLSGPQSIPADYSENWDAAVEHFWASELELVARHSPTGVMWVSQGMDDALPMASHGGDEPIDVTGFMAAWNEREAAPMRFATPLEFYEALEARREQVPVVEDTLDPCDVCFNAAWAGSHGLWRKRVVADDELVRMQLWEALLGASADADHLWEDVLRFSCHATQWLFQQDFDELDELAEQTILGARSRRRLALQGLARRIEQPQNSAAVIFNSLPYPRREIVPVLLTHSTGLPMAIEVLDPSGRSLPHQIVNKMEYAGRIWEAEALVEVDVPACGYTSVGWREAGERPGEPAAVEEMDSGLVRLEFEQGAVARVRWQDRILSGATPLGGLRLYDVDTAAPLHVGPIVATHEPVWESFRIIEHGPLRWRSVSEGRIGPHELSLETSLRAGQPRLDFRLTVHWQGHDGFLAALWPLLDGATLATDAPFGAEEKHLDGITYGKIPGHRSDNIERLREGMFYAKSFVSQQAGDMGLSFITHDGDRYFIRDPQEGSLAHILINSVRPVAHGWECHVNLQREGRGRHEFNWSIVLHEGDWRESGMRQLAERLRHPVEVLLPEGSDGSLPGSQSLLSIEPERAVLSALYQEADGVCLRLWESVGEPAQVRLMLPWEVQSAEAMDFNGQPLDTPKPQIEGRILSLDLRPWEIVTLKLSALTAVEPAQALQ